MFINAELAQIGDTYNKAQLEKGFLPYVTKFYSKDIFINEDVVLTGILHKAATKKQVSKEELIYLCFSIFKNKEIYLKFIVNLLPEIKILIEKLLWVEKMSETEIESEVYETITCMDQSYYDGRKLKDPYAFF